MKVLAGLALAGLAGTAFWLLIAHQVEALLQPVRSAVTRPPQLAAARDVAFTAEDGVTISGWYLPGPRHTTVILCHGHGESRIQMVPEAMLLARHGFGVLLFDWRAHGESGGALSTRGDQERRDLKAAVDLLARDADAGALGALGFSRGASVLNEVAARDARIRAVVAQAASPSLAEGLVRDVSGPAILSRWPAIWRARRAGIDVDGFRPEQSIASIGPRPLLLIHGGRDDAVPVQWVQRLYAAAKEPKDLWLIDGAAHGQYAAAAGPEYEQRLLSFFTQALPAGVHSPAAAGANPPKKSAAGRGP